MPSIGVRIGQAGGGDFSGLYGAQGRGIAAGLETSSQLHRQALEENALKEAQAAERDARDQAEAEKRSAHNYYEQRLAEVVKDPNKLEAARGLDIGTLVHVYEREAGLKAIEDQAKSLRRSKDFLATHPRGKLMSDQLDELQAAGGL